MKPDLNANEEWLTLKQVEKMLNIGPMALWKLRKAGKIKDYYPNGRPTNGRAAGKVLVRIARSEVNRFVTEESRNDI